MLCKLPLYNDYMHIIYTYNICIHVCILVSGQIMGGSKETCADISDVAQVTDIRTLPNCMSIDVNW